MKCRPAQQTFWLPTGECYDFIGKATGNDGKSAGSRLLQWLPITPTDPTEQGDSLKELPRPAPQMAYVFILHIESPT